MGDGDRLLDICQALLEHLREVKRAMDHLNQVENTQEWIRGNPSY
jgi:hypothetical protein